MFRRVAPGGAAGLIGIGDMRAATRSTLTTVAILTAALWLITIGQCLFLMVLLDVALPGKSAPSFVGLIAMAGVLVIFQSVLLTHRQRTLAAFCALCDAAGHPLHQVRQDALRRTLQGGAAVAAIDAACLPLFLFVLALLLGWVAAIPLTAAAIGVMVLIAETRRDRPETMPEEAQRARDLAGAAVAAQQNYLALLGLGDRAAAVLTAHRHATAQAVAATARRERGVSALLSLLAALSLAGVAGAATWMVAMDAASIGSLAAALLLNAAMFKPLPRIAADIGTLARARAEWQLLQEAVSEPVAAAPAVTLPPPHRELDVAGVTVPFPGSRRLTLQDVTFKAAAGDLVAVIGPADAGKSTLLKVLAGQISHAAGTVRLDGAALNQWDRSRLVRHIGYVPQIPDLMPGSVAENIAGFASMPDPNAITRAAQAAGVHEAIVRLPSGYDTVVGAPDHPAMALSVQQRIAWARALYGQPFVLLLDSPAAFQDNDGQMALRRCLQGQRMRGAVTVVVGDSASIIDSANLVLVMRKGGVVDFGPKEDVRARLAERQRREAERLAEVSVCADPRGTAAETPLVE